MQAGETSGDEAFSPETDGMSITVEVGGDVLVRGSVVLGSVKDKATAEGESLGCGAGPDQGLELLAVVVGEDDG